MKSTSEKLYAVYPIVRKTGKAGLPRFELAPMNHAAACNFMEACRNDYADYALIPWPNEVPHPKPPMFATGYRRDKDIPKD